MKIFRISQTKEHKEYYKQFNGEMVDSFAIDDYTFSLWHYKDADEYEVNFSFGEYDWLNPDVQKAKLPGGKSVMPIKQIAEKMHQWMAIRGHLLVGTNNAENLSKYKRIFAYMFPAAEIFDYKGDVPSGGKYFFVITTDFDVKNRASAQSEGQAYTT